VSRNDEVAAQRVKKPGTEADRPTLPGGRGTPGARGAGAGAGFFAVLPKPKKSRSDGVAD
jgi:hypothetical protein